MAFGEKLILIDASCLINLYATGRIREILEAQAWPAGVVVVVAGESQYIRRGGTGDDAKEREPIDLRPLLSEGVLRTLDFESDEEYERFVDYASAGLDDGEAMTLALAQVRGHQVATDDLKARREAAALEPGMECHSTVALLQRWASAVQVTRDVLEETVLSIEQRGNWWPRPADVAQCDWWRQAGGRHP